MEAVTEVNRTSDDGIKQFIFPSSVSVYGSDFPRRRQRKKPRSQHTRYLTRSTRKKRMRSCSNDALPLRGCSVYILRPHIFAGATVENYLMGAFRGTPNGQGPACAENAGARESDYPACFLAASKYLDNKIQFVHVDDMARLIQSHPAARTRVSAADGAQCCGTR